jgi:hypothetical protein
MRVLIDRIISTRKAFLLVAPVYGLLATLFLYLGMAAQRLTLDPDPTHLLLDWGFGKPQSLYCKTFYIDTQIYDVQMWCEILGFVFATIVTCLLFGRSQTKKVEVAMVFEAFALYQLLVFLSVELFPLLRERLIDSSWVFGIFLMFYIILPMAFLLRYLMARAQRHYSTSSC